MAKFSGKTGKFVKKAGLVAAPFLALLLTSCNGRHEIKYYSEKLGIDFWYGDVYYFEDNHGGFLGDGYMLCEVLFPDEKIERQIKKSEYFIQYPLSENLKKFLYEPFDDSLNIPEFDNGYFYFYNRHSDAKNKDTDEDLFDTVSFNFTFVLYDCDEDMAYICEYDT